MIKNILVTVLSLMLTIIISVLVVDNYNQYKNISDLLNQHLDGKLIPHKADYMNKLKNILDDHLRSFEFDVRFNETSETPFFEVGHDRKDLDGISFEDYLVLTENLHMKKIWMDVKNLNRNNVSRMLERLNYLDKKYSIKNILIFETDSTIPEVRIISDAGYHTSYYLSSEILNAIAKNNMLEMIKEARRIKNQIEAQHIKAISFPDVLYWFVKSCIEPIISGQIVYHTWGGYRFKKKDELVQIQHKNFYHDKRVKTIIYSYYNNKFNRLYSY